MESWPFQFVARLHDMSTTVKAQLAPRQGNSLALDLSAEDKELALYRQHLREAIEESGEKKEFVAAEMGLPGPEYLSKLFSGEKSISARHIVGLPDNVEAIFEAKRAKHHGHVVVAPLHGADAIEALVAGLVGVIGGHRLPLPARADHPAKAQLRSESGKKSEVA